MIRTLLIVIAGLVLALGYSGWRASAEGRKADAAETRAELAEGQLAAAQAALVLAALSDTATETARAAVADHHADHQTRAERVETIANVPRPPVSADCPVPDADLVRESAGAAERIRAAEGRLRSLRPAADPGPGAAPRR